MAVTTTFSWTGGLNEFFNNGFTSGSQFAPAAASSFDRSEYLGAWGDPNGNFQVEARIQNSASQPVTDEFTVNTTTNTNFQFDPSVAGLTGGNFVVTYTDTNVDPGGDIRARIIGPSGGGAADFAVDVGGSDDSQSAVAELSGGGFVVTYTRNLGGGDLDIVARRFDSAGTPQGGLIIVDQPGGAQTASQVAGLTSGGFVVVWEDAGVDEVYFRRFDASGVALGGRVLIDTNGTINTDIHVVALNDGGFAVAYTDNEGGAGTDISFRIFNADGSTRTPLIRANDAAFGGAEAGDQNLPTITTLGTNDLIVVGWRNAGEISFGQVFDTSGNPVGTNQTFNSAVLEHEFAGLSGGLMANVRASSFSEGTGLGNSIRTTVQEFTRSLTSDGASDTITGINDGLREILNGNGGDDILIGGTGNDALNGGSGFDTAVFSGLRSAYVLTRSGTSLNVLGPDGSDTLTGIEKLAFTDGTIPSGLSPAPSDFNGDGKSDILWQHDGGLPIMWTMDGTTVTGSAALPNPGPTWHVAEAADFNGDGKSDILWQHDGGLPIMWTMDGTTVTGSAALPNPGPTWHVAEAADFNGDGKSDILWQHDGGLPIMWTMDGTNITGSAALPNPGPNWHVAEAADFNGDGKSDILWQHDGGLPIMWTMDGTNITGSAALPNPGPTWHVAEAADFNGDGKSDILWQHDGGLPIMWTMDGTNITGSAALPNPGATWHVAEAADFNGDGRSDILWQHDGGLPIMWTMDGTNITGSAALPNPGSDWHIL